MEKRLEMLESKVDALCGLVELLIHERDEAREAERRALERNAEMFAYYQAEEYKARQEALESEDARDD